MPRTGSIASNVGPAVTSTRLPAEHLRRARRDERREDFLRLEHAALADFAARLVRRRPGPRIATPSATSCATLRCVAAFAHICRFIAGATSSGHSRARHSVDRRSSACPARAWRGNRPTRARRRSRRRRARLDMAHRVVGARSRGRSHRSAGERLERHRRDEARRRLGHHDVDDDAVLDEQARELGRLVRGDAAGHAEDDARERAGVRGRRSVIRFDTRGVGGEVYTAPDCDVHASAAGREASRAIGCKMPMANRRMALASGRANGCWRSARRP